MRTKSCVYLWEGDLSRIKVYEEMLRYPEGSPLTLRNHFIQPYRALDTLLQILLTLGIMYKSLRDVLFEIFVVNWSSEKY